MGLSRMSVQLTSVAPPFLEDEDSETVVSAGKSAAKAEMFAPGAIGPATRLISGNAVAARTPERRHPAALG